MCYSRYIPQRAGFSLAMLASLLAVEVRAFDAVRTTELNAPLTQYEGPLGPLERTLFADAAAGRIDERGLLRGALIASGISEPQRLASYLDRVAAWDYPLREAGARCGQLLPTARVVLEFMHRRILRGGYRPESTDLLQTIDGGRYNCVSATVLYSALVARFGIAVQGLEFPGHVMSRPSLNGASLDVETTCSRWFRLADDPRQQDELLERTLGGPDSYAAKLARRREVSPTQLVAMIYYNRGVDLLAQRRYAEALAANAKALRLDPESQVARGNLLATLNNWAIALGDAGQYRQAADTLEAGLAIDPTFAPFAANYAHVHHQWVERLCQTHDFSHALAILRQAVDKRPSDAYLRSAAADVYRQWTQQGPRADDLTDRGL